jgi:hypothetical protein
VVEKNSLREKGKRKVERCKRKRKDAADGGGKMKLKSSRCKINRRCTLNGK